jgi:hypothetical protein
LKGDEVKDKQVQVNSMFGYNTGQPAVSLKIDDIETQMSPAKAREIALLLLGAAEAAIGDAFIFSFVTELIGADVSAAGGLLQEFRRWRNEHQVDEVTE